MRTNVLELKSELSSTNMVQNRTTSGWVWTPHLSTPVS